MKFLLFISRVLTIVVSIASEYVLCVGGEKWKAATFLHTVKRLYNRVKSVAEQMGPLYGHYVILLVCYF